MNSKVLVAGAGGFIGGHLVRSLLEAGEDVIATDIKPLHRWYQVHDKSLKVDLMDLSVDKCANYITSLGIKDVYMLAADMGGMGYIDAHKTDCMMSVLISANMLKYASHHGIERYLYTSSACVYPGFMQEDKEVFLKESDAYPADPEPGYGLEKLFSEELAINMGIENTINTYVPRLHNVYGPYGTYDGGREKAPAAICRKIIEAKLSGDLSIDIWGDGQQTRSFMYVDDCLEGFNRIINSDVHFPINLGSDFLVSINQLVTFVELIAETNLKRNYDLSKPQGVRGRCSDNALIKESLNWEPSVELLNGLEKTYRWIYDQILKDNNE